MPLSNAMHLSDILNVGYKLNDWLNFFWNFYVAFSGIVVGWVFSSKEDWRKSQKIVVTLFYIGFTVVSLGALIRTYKALDAVVEKLCTLLPSGDNFNEILINQFQSNYWILKIFLHIGGDLLVLYCVWALSMKGTAQPVTPADPPAAASQRPSVG